MDVMDFYHRATGQSVPVPQVLISFRIVKSEDQSVQIEDLTEASAKQILFPNAVAQLTPEKRSELFEHIVDWFVREAVSRASK